MGNEMVLSWLRLNKNTLCVLVAACFLTVYGLFDLVDFPIICTDLIVKDCIC